MKRAAMAVVLMVTVGVADLPLAQAQLKPILRCRDKSGNLVITNERGAAGLTCPPDPEPPPKASPRIRARPPDPFSPSCRKEINMNQYARSDDQEAWQKFGRRQNTVRLLSESCLKELEAEVEKSKQREAERNSKREQR